ncbi:MAG: MATE family efflux transporter [Oscillospiraceae bacterium]|nr:MATE family efflux transporter [Oscillospiraceae bacterium]
MSAKFQRDMTQGSVARHLILFSMPFLAANLLQALYNMADMFFVGRYNGPVGASAVGAGGQINNMMLQLISGLAIGGTVLIAQLIGAKQIDQLRKTVGTVFTLYCVMAFSLTAVMLVVNPFLVRLMADAAAYDATLEYVQICTGGLFFIFGYNAVSAVLRGMGDSKHPLMFVLVAVVLNIGLDYVFCGWMHMGAKGAAWATVVAQGVSFLLAAIFLRRSDFVFDFRPKSLRIDRKIALQLLRIGFPSSLGATAVALSFMTLTGMAKSIRGLVGTTALSVTSKANSVGILPAVAMQASVSSMAGQNLGAGMPKRALRTSVTGIGITLAITLVVFILMQIFADHVVAFFIGSGGQGLDVNTAQACLEESAAYLRAVSWDYLVVSIGFNISALAISAGHTTYNLVVGLAGSILVRVPVAYLLASSSLGLQGMGYAVPITTMVAMLSHLVYLGSGRWKHSKIIQRVAAEGSARQELEKT